MVAPPRHDSAPNEPVTYLLAPVLSGAGRAEAEAEGAGAVFLDAALGQAHRTGRALHGSAPIPQGVALSWVRAPAWAPVPGPLG